MRTSLTCCRTPSHCAPGVWRTNCSGCLNCCVGSTRDTSNRSGPTRPPCLRFARNHFRNCSRIARSCVLTIPVLASRHIRLIITEQDLIRRSARGCHSLLLTGVPSITQSQSVPNDHSTHARLTAPVHVMDCRYTPVTLNHHGLAEKTLRVGQCAPKAPHHICLIGLNAKHVDFPPPARSGNSTNAPSCSGIKLR